MKSKNQGPSPEGPRLLRALRVVATIGAAWLSLVSGGFAYAQAPPVTSEQSITVESGVSVTVPADVTGAASIQIASSPSHGTASALGMSLTYKSAKNYVGADTFMYSARNSGNGEFDVYQWVTVEVTAPRPSLPNNMAFTVPYGGSGTYTFNPSPDGVVSIETPPNKGTATLNGKVVTYEAAPGAVGLAYFYVAATNAAGKSDVQMVRVTVQPAQTPTISGPPGSSGYPNTSQTYNYETTGADSIEVAVEPTSGTVTIAGNSVTYTPATDFIGTDTYSVRARGPGGVSASVSTSPNVRLPPPPSLNGGALNLAFNASGSHFMGISPYTPSIVITQQPLHGTAKLNGFNVSYQPNANYIGTDSFAVTGTNLAGNSVANITVNVAPPPVPTLTGGALNLAFNTSGAHNFAPTHGGTIALSSAPSHGVVTISAGRATYTPETDYIGPDSFSVIGTNLGGESPAATVNVTVSKPDAPGAGSATLSTAFETAGQLELPASGLFNQIDIIDQPGNGTIALVGTTATYTPAPGFFGDDAFTYQVTGLGGTSGVASVAVKVSRPGVPTISATSAVQTPFGIAVTIPFKVSGIFSSLKIHPLPANGTATIGSNEVTYQPNPGFSGRDTVKVVAVGPGGDSLPAEIEVSVAADVVVEPPAKPPISKPGALSQEGQAGSQMRFRVTAGITETVQAVEILSQPPQGKAHVDALDVIYSPPADFVGQVAFDYRLLTEDGVSEPATLTATVHAPAQEAPVKAAEATTDDPASVELTEGVENGPFSDAAIISMSPASAGTVELIRGNSASPARSSMRAVASTTSAKMGASSAPPEQSAGSFKMLFKPADDFFGVVTVRYSLTNRFDAPTTGVVKITVDNRKDPTLDPKVAALVNSQADTIGRFGETQIANTSRRMESIRAGAASRGGVSFGSARPTIGEDLFTDRSRQQMMAELREATAPAATEASAADQPANSTANPTRVSVWTGGSVQLGERRAEGSTGGFDFTTSGVSVGADYKISDHLVVGAGAGFGRDVSDLGDGAKVKAHGYSSFLYASFKPSDLLFIDGVVGGGRASFTTDRLAASGTPLHGERDGSQWFAAFSGGLELKLTSWMISPYGRFEAMSAKLDGYREDGESAGALRFASQRVDRQSGILGLRGSRQIVLDSGLLEPTFRGEYRWSLRDTGVARLDYAHGQEGTRYEIPLSVFEDEALTLGLGAAFRSRAGWNAWLEWEASMQGAQSTTNTLRAGGNLAF